jgi:DNA-binding transcriptional LysR family regulator
MAYRIDPYSLRLLSAAVRHGSIQEAAAHEHIAASALSRRISDLERILGKPLLVRQARGVRPTRAGRLAIETSQRIGDELDSLAHKATQEGSAIDGTVRLFASPSSVIGLLPEKLKAFNDRYPAARVMIDERPSSDVVRACLDGSADLGVCVASPVRKGLDSWLFADDSAIVLLPQGHPLATAKTIQFNDILPYPLICAHVGGALDELLRARALKAGVKLDIAMSVSSNDSVCRMVQAGHGIAVLPQSAASAYAGARCFERRPLAEAWARRELRIYALREARRSRTVAALVDVLKGRR